MRKRSLLLLTASTVVFLGLFFFSSSRNPRANAQSANNALNANSPGCPCPTPTVEPAKIPEVITLGQDAKLGQITFNHVKHNGGAYNIVQGQKIACISCHHTAQPNSEVVKNPPLKTSWPADRTTTLTQELFDKDPKAAGVAACRECHAREGMTPKLIPAIPEIKHESSTVMIKMTNMTAFHRACTSCHAEVRKTNPLSKGPIQTQCTMCHKKAA
ncbi:MAG: cytochrome c3 family protein [Acidobacteria bacterium]|nr:cytochrome c3 family protein [Acidobacteriota bacterium]